MQRTFKDIVKEQIPPQVIMVIALVVILVTGYCIWLTSNSGSISVTAPLYATDIYVDGIRLETSAKAGQTLTFDYPIGNHDVIVSRAGFWPWTQTVTVQKNKTVQLLPFLLEQKPSIEHMAAQDYNGEYLSDDPDYVQKMSVFDTLAIADSVAPLLKSMNFQDVHSADFFPGRSDVLIVAAGQKVFAVDINNTNPRNFEPIFEGNSPEFFKATDNTLYIKDGTSLYHVTGLVPAS